VADEHVIRVLAGDAYALRAVVACCRRGLDPD